MQSLVIETSFHLFVQLLSHWLECIYLKKLGTASTDVVLSAEDKDRVFSLAYATRNASKAVLLDGFGQVQWHGLRTYEILSGTLNPSG
ncbi:hypothetical protein EON65_49095 [archaeon]|nr:MAG: hypothetical protein EON65_49095 [archaeon]